MPSHRHLTALLIGLATTLAARGEGVYDYSASMSGTANQCNTTSCYNVIGVNLTAAIYNNTGSIKRWRIVEIDEQYDGPRFVHYDFDSDFTTSSDSGITPGSPGTTTVGHEGIGTSSLLQKNGQPTTDSLYEAFRYSLVSHPDPFNFSYVIKKALNFEVETPFDSGTWVLVDSAQVTFRGDVFVDVIPGIDGGGNTPLFPARKMIAHFYMGGKHGPRLGEDDYPLVLLEPPVAAEEDAEPPDCCSCRSSTVNTSLNSVQAAFALGPFQDLTPGASLILDIPTPRPDLYRPHVLEYPIKDGFARIDDDTTKAVLQFQAPSTVVDVTDESATNERYVLTFYARDSSWPLLPDGTIDIPPAETELATVTVENPDTSGATTNQLRITREEDLDTRTWDYLYTDATGEWRLSDSESPWIEKLTETDIGDTDANGFDEILKHRILEDLAGNPISETKTTWEVYPFGTRPVRRVTDPDGRALTETWEYFSNPSVTAYRYGRLRSRVDPSGYWERYGYSTTDAPISSNGTPYTSVIVRQHLDAPVGSPDAASEVERIVFETPDRILRTVKLLDQEVARSFLIDLPDGYDEIHCQSAGADHLASDNLVTRTRFHTSGPFADELASIRRPDDTMEFYSYSLSPLTGDKTTTVRSGKPNATFDDIVDGTETVTIDNAQGSTVATTVTDIASGLLVDQSLASAVDAYGRPTTVSFLDGTTESTVYGCCGIDSRTDRRGITTTFTDSGGTSTQTRLGITLTTVETPYDDGSNQGRRTTVTRKGTDASEILTSLTETNLAGEVIRTRDARGEDTFYATTIAPVTGYTVRTTTHPDGGTRIETLYPDGSLFTVGGTAARPRKYEYGIDATGRFTREILLDALGGENEWTLTYVDFSGRTSQVIRPLPGGGTATASSHYDGLGRLERSIDPDGVTSLRGYDDRGRPDVQALDIDRDGVIDFDGTDRIVKTETFVTTRPGGRVVARTTQTAWNLDNDGLTTVLLSTTDRAVDGLDTWVETGGLTTHSNTTPTGPSAWTETTTYPDNSERVRLFTAGRLASDTLNNSLGGQLLASTYTYDAHGRVATTTDARADDGNPLTTGDSTVFTYFDDDQVDTLTTPAPNATDPAQVTGFTYDAMGRRDIVTLPDHTPGDPRQVNYDYYPTGDLERVSGARTYTADYDYTAQGRLDTLVTAGGTTSWEYFSESGLLSKKIHPDTTDVDYTYKDSGRLETRETARGIVTTYAYNDAGQLETATYSDTTPGVAYGYNRLGGLRSVLRDGSTHLVNENAFGQLLDETITGGILDGALIDPAYDSFRRRSTLTTSTGSASVAQAYTYDSASRLHTASQRSHSATYFYEPGATLVSDIQFHTAGALAGALAKDHDLLGRLESTTAASTGSAPLNRSFTYRHNNANQRDRVEFEDLTFWEYEYDDLGHLDSGKRFRLPGEPLAGQQYEYLYDGIGNRTTTHAGGNASGTGLLPTAYTPKPGDPNQYDTIARPGAISVTGRADASAAVTVNGNPANRQGEYFSLELPVDNSGGAVNQALTIEAVLGPDTDTVTRSQLVPPASVTFQYDLDGNLTSDGLRTFTWDGENRLTRIETNAAALPPGAPEYRLDYAYDYLGRRIRKQVFTKPAPGGAGPFVITSERKFLYDGWNLVAEFENEDELIRSYLWGLDLAGQSGAPPHAQAAGGVGGLLAITRHSGPNAGTHYATADGNGNLTGLINAATANLSASYDYDPYGNPHAATGPFAHENPFRFSTKYHDPTPNLYYYGFRHYDPTQGRWLNRDPLAENGGLNLYAFTANTPPNAIDPLGLALYAFDGTANVYEQQTHVGILHKSYEGSKRYENGVGSVFRGPLDNSVVGGITGAGAKTRIASMYSKFRTLWKAGDKKVDIIGFSRGAALARHFANILHEKGYTPEGSARKCEDVSIRFLGIFDTVASFGEPGNHTNIGINLSIPPNVNHVAHAVAADEKRALFPVTLIGSPSINQNFSEVAFPGDHSNIGGGHGNWLRTFSGRGPPIKPVWQSSNRRISIAPLVYIWRQGKAAAVPFGPLPNRTLIQSNEPHNLSLSFGGLVGPFLFGDGYDRNNPIQDRGISPGVIQ